MLIVNLPKLHVCVNEFIQDLLLFMFSPRYKCGNTYHLHNEIIQVSNKQSPTAYITF